MDSKLPGSKGVPGKLLVGMVNANVYKSEPIFTYLGHGNVPWFLT